MNVNYHHHGNETTKCSYKIQINNFIFGKFNLSGDDFFIPVFQNIFYFLRLLSVAHGFYLPDDQRSAAACSNHVMNVKNSDENKFIVLVKNIL